MQKLRESERAEERNHPQCGVVLRVVETPLISCCRDPLKGLGKGHVAGLTIDTTSTASRLWCVQKGVAEGSGECKLGKKVPWSSIKLGGTVEIVLSQVIES